MSRDYRPIRLRGLKAHELRQNGLKWREIGDLLGGVSASRAFRLGERGERYQMFIDRGDMVDPRLS